MATKLLIRTRQQTPDITPNVLQLGRRFLTYLVAAVIVSESFIDAVVAGTDSRWVEAAIRMMGGGVFFMIAIIVERVKVAEGG